MSAEAIRKAFVAAAAIGMLTLGAGTASASDLDCSDFETPVTIVNGFDPNRLDRDGNGIGCESNPGEPVTSDLYADLSGGDATATPTPELAETGWGPGEHPVRWMATCGALVVGGLATVAVTRRKGAVVDGRS